MKRIFVDAYNFLFTLESRGSSLEEKRHELIDWADEVAEKLNCFLVLVFDGERKVKRGYFQRSHVKNLEIIFTPPGITADEYILEALLGREKNERILVVTSDRFLSSQSRRLGAEAMTIRGFIRWAASKIEKKTKTSEKLLKETDHHLARYLKIFQEKLENPES